MRLAAAYEDPGLLKFHLSDVGSAAGRAAALADPGLRVSTQGQVLTAGDYLSAYVLEWTLHHLDLVAHLPGAGAPPAECLARSRDILAQIAGVVFPPVWSDRDALLVGTGRRGPDRYGARRTGGAGREAPTRPRLRPVLGLAGTISPRTASVWRRTARPWRRRTRCGSGTGRAATAAGRRSARCTGP